jgi:hypothetical protein
MLQLKQTLLSVRESRSFMRPADKEVGIFSGLGNQQENRVAVSQQFDASSEETTESDERDAPLDDAAESEREYVRQRLREELKREPTEEELDEWLRQHTEGY